jgi:hypothetical protein
MWQDGYRSICREHPDLVAVYESPGGELALLLDDTLLPPPTARQRCRWLEQTRKAARRIVADLRRAGLQDDVRLVQSLPLAEVGEVLSRWSCRYDRGAPAA